MPPLPPPRSAPRPKKRVKELREADYLEILIKLDRLYHEMMQTHMEDMRAIGSRIPAGGAHMDLFFRLEGLRGAMTALRLGDKLEQAIQAGKDVSSLAVLAWNNRREYQVHRWDKTAHDFIENTIRRLAKDAAAT